MFLRPYFTKLYKLMKLVQVCIMILFCFLLHENISQLPFVCFIFFIFVALYVIIKEQLNKKQRFTI